MLLRHRKRCAHRTPEHTALREPRQLGLRQIAEELAYGSELGFHNTMNMELEGLVPYDVVERIVREKATKVWGQAVAGTPVACGDSAGDLAAYLRPFRIAEGLFPSHAGILWGVFGMPPPQDFPC